MNSWSYELIHTLLSRVYSFFFNSVFRIERIFSFEMHINMHIFHKSIVNAHSNASSEISWVFLLYRSCCLFFTRCHIKKRANYRKNTILPLKIISKYPHYAHSTRGCIDGVISQRKKCHCCVFRVEEKVVKFQSNVVLRKSDIIFCEN